MTGNETKVINAFHNLYYNGVDNQGPIFKNTFWMGVSCLKCPLDLWIYQEILFEIKPDLIIETGTAAGGSTLFLAHICDLLNHGRVASIDINEQPRPQHKRILYILGSSSDRHSVEIALDWRRGRGKVLVILDADHSEEHVAKELELFAPLVSIGSYIIVEDTNLNGHPAFSSFGPGPYEAVQKFIDKNNNSFMIDSSKERFLMTFNPKGFLKRMEN